MTETEWLACGDVADMLQFLRPCVSDRKFRLFGVACYRSLWARTTVDAIHRKVVEASEAYAERKISKAEFKFVRKQLGLDGPKVTGEAWEVALWSSFDCGGANWTLVGGTGNLHWQRPDEVENQRHLLDCIFGNPFRPVPFNPQWRTDTALTLAKGMYDGRDFGAMPILADALQDAGCEQEDILSHCRSGGVHVRGCWVVDLVLGKGDR